MKENILCTICARKGSKGVPNKNIKLINGAPLISYTIKTALQSKLFSYVVVNSDSDEILNTALACGANAVFKRPDELARDDSPKVPAIRNAFTQAEEYFKENFTLLVDLDCTSPLRNIEDISNALIQFKTGKFDNLFSVCEARKSPYFSIVEYNSENKIRPSKQLQSYLTQRQQSPVCYEANGSIYIWSRDSILSRYDTVFQDNTGIYIMPPERSLDIDSELDFKLVETLLKSKST